MCVRQHASVIMIRIAMVQVVEWSLRKPNEQGERSRDCGELLQPLSVYGPI